ncbi:unnamed protein product, partial [Gadus morhua 'NCC']
MSSVEHLFLQALHLLAILEKILSTHPVDAGMLRMCLVIDSMLGRETQSRMTSAISRPRRKRRNKSRCSFSLCKALWHTTLVDEEEFVFPG